MRVDANTLTKWYQSQVTINNDRRRHEGWGLDLLDRQALGAIKISLAKNVAYNVANEKTTYGLFKAMSNMYEKPSASDKSWSGIVTAVSGSTRTTKLKFDNIHDLIRSEDVCRKTSGAFLKSLLSAIDKDKGRKQDREHKQNKGRSKSKKRGQSKNRHDITC
nr:hypothetical protein [Tanacetum cinerariifolium]